MKLFAGTVKSAEGKIANVVVKPSFIKHGKTKVMALGGIIIAAAYGIANEFFKAGAYGHFNAEYEAFNKIGHISSSNEEHTCYEEGPESVTIDPSGHVEED